MTEGQLWIWNLLQPFVILSLNQLINPIKGHLHITIHLDMV